jgi:hypothetical protein
MVTLSAQKTKPVLSIVLFVLAFTTPIWCLLVLYLKYGSSPTYDFRYGVIFYALIWLSIITLFWLIVTIISPSIWLRILSIICVVFAVRHLFFLLGTYH